MCTPPALSSCMSHAISISHNSFASLTCTALNGEVYLSTDTQSRAQLRAIANPPVELTYQSMIARERRQG
jgi:hypothetical protein